MEGAARLVARPAARRRRRAAALGLTLVLGASGAASGDRTVEAGRQAIGWSDYGTENSEQTRCPDEVGGAVSRLLASCQASAPLRLSSEAVSASETRLVCATPACVAWFVAVALPECAYRGDVSARALAQTFLRMCDGLETREAPDADGSARLYRHNVRANVAVERRRMQQADSPSDSSSSSSGGDSASGSDAALHSLGLGSAISGLEDSSSTVQSSASELAMSYLYICLILALFNCSYLFFMRKT